MNVEQVSPVQPVTRKKVTAPNRVDLGSLVDTARVVSAGQQIANLTGVVTSVLSCEETVPTPVAPHTEVLFDPTGSCGRPGDPRFAACLNSHWQAALTAMKQARAVQVAGDCNRMFYSYPILLDYQGEKYAKAAITLGPPSPGGDILEASVVVELITKGLSDEISARYLLHRRDALASAAEARLRAENERLEMFLEHVGGGLAVFEPDCHILWTNKATERHLALESPATGKHCRDVLHPRPDRDQCNRCPMPRAFQSGLEQREVLAIVTPQGETRYYMGTATPVKDPTGRTVNVVTVCQDITERQRMEMELEKRNEMLELQNRRVVEATREKSRFFASMSHELRSPMTSIVGFIGILLEDTEEPLAPRQRDILVKVNQNAERLLAIINDLLDLSKIESGRMTVNVTKVDLSTLINQVVDSMAPLVREKEVTLTAEVADDVPVIRTDEHKLSQIVVNLVSNAIKFTPKGSVTVRAALDGRRVSIAVSDTGIGVRRTDFSKIFEEFRQVEGCGPRKTGTGLGLAITRRLVHLLGGKIHLSSKLGQGSTFTVLLPISLSRAAAGRRARATELQSVE